MCYTAVYFAGYFVCFGGNALIASPMNSLRSSFFIYVFNLYAIKTLSPRDIVKVCFYVKYLWFILSVISLPRT